MFEGYESSFLSRVGYRVCIVKLRIANHVGFMQAMRKVSVFARSSRTQRLAYQFGKIFLRISLSWAGPGKGINSGNAYLAACLQARGRGIVDAAEVPRGGKSAVCPNFASGCRWGTGYDRRVKGE